MTNEKVKVCDLPKGVCAKARKEGRLLYVDWKLECVMSAPTAGATPLSDEEIAKRVKANAKTSKRRKEINADLSKLRKAMSQAGKEGNADEVKRLAEQVGALEGEKSQLKMLSVPSRKTAEDDEGSEESEEVDEK